MLIYCFVNFFTFLARSNHESFQCILILLSCIYDNINTIYYTMLCYATLRHATPRHAIPYHTIPYHTIPYYTILYYTILYYTILYYSEPRCAQGSCKREFSKRTALPVPCRVRFMLGVVLRAKKVKKPLVFLGFWLLFEVYVEVKFKRLPRRGQRRPKRPPRRATTRPRRPQEASKSAQDAHESDFWSIFGWIWVDFS